MRFGDRLVGINGFGAKGTATFRRRGVFESNGDDRLETFQNVPPAANLQPVEINTPTVVLGGLLAPISILELEQSS